MTKKELYKTAIAAIACAKFGAGDVVAVTYSHTSRGVDWYLITATQHGTLDHPVAYPSHHLTMFAL